MAHVSHRPTPARRLFAEGEYMGHYFGHPLDPRTPDDGKTDCELCNAKGWRMVLDEENKPVRIECEACEGYRYLDSEGFPYKTQENE